MGIANLVTTLRITLNVDKISGVSEGKKFAGLERNSWVGHCNQLCSANSFSCPNSMHFKNVEFALDLRWSFKTSKVRNLERLAN